LIHRAYDRSAFYYDTIYSWKNYQKESEKLHEFIQLQKKSAGKMLLDAACGTGGHIAYLKEQYSVEGLDINPKMLKLARKKFPGITFYRGDMCAFHLGKKYDVVTCLFSAIGHVKTLVRLRKAVRQMAFHLRPGGLLVVEPWFTPEQWRVGHVSAKFVDQPKLKLARIGIGKRRGGLSVDDQYHLVGSPGRVEYFVEHYEMGLFSHEQYLQSFQDAGLGVSFDKEGLMGRGLYLGVKP
jgi:ubiquinone/menaquinone biosynthesis C-methylase UbiE